MKLNFIAHGIGGNPFKLEKLENKFNEKIFPTSMANHLDSIDEDLTSLVFTYYDKNKENFISSYDNKMSLKTKKLMSRYEAYNILMSEKFRNFIKNKQKLQFYNPKTNSESISIISRNMNNKIQFEPNSKQICLTQRNPFKLYNNKYIKTSKTESGLDIDENLINLSNSPNSTTKPEEIINDMKLYSNNKFKFQNIQNYKFFFKNKLNKSKKTSLFLSPSILSKNTKNSSNKKPKYKFKKKLDMLEIDFEKKNLENITSKNYLRKYFYYDKLSDKEIKFQKELLYYKYNNSLYNSNNSIEEKNGIISKDNLDKCSLIINEKAKEKVQSTVKENLIDLDLLKDTFGKKQNKISLKMKSAMSSVINKYINEKKSRVKKEHLINVEGIQKNNKKKLLLLGNCINSINYNISEIKNLLK